MVNISLSLLLGALSFVSAHGAARLDKRAEGQAPSYMNCKNPKQVALTFDDGVSQYEKSLSEYLRKQNVTATFFVNGNNWACIYDKLDQVKAIHDNGHLIASHSWSHPDMTTLNDKQARQQLDLVETALKKMIGVVPKWFRFPYGANSASLLQLAKEYKYETVLWNYDTEDGDGNTVAYAKKQYDALAKTYPKQGIVLNHSPYQTTAEDVIPYAVKLLKSKGYELVDVATCLNYAKSAWYKSTTTPGKKDSTWTCSGTPSS